MALLCCVVTVLEVIQRSTEFLARKGIDSPRLQIELLLAHALGVPRLKLYLDFERLLTEQELQVMRSLVKRRAAREPLQHIIGSTSFCGLEIKVTADVLVPRPETESLAERGWQTLQARAKEKDGPVTALDLGTGSGCLAIALAVHVPEAQLYAVDISTAALAVALENASRHQVADRIRFIEADGLRGVPMDLRLDLLVSNPPYIPSAEIERLAPEVREHDPRVALDGGPDGLAFYRRLAVEAPQLMNPKWRLMCEFGDGQADAVGQIFRESGWDVVTVERDLSGCARILVACRTES